MIILTAVLFILVLANKLNNNITLYFHFHKSFLEFSTELFISSN